MAEFLIAGEKLLGACKLRVGDHVAAAQPRQLLPATFPVEETDTRIGTSTAFGFLY